jgi:hypothetical protein
MAYLAYFSFDYEDAADFRAGVVRDHKFAGGIEKAGYFAKSTWAESKKKDPSELKRQIDGALEGTFASVVLIGDLTYARRWVRYEIFKSVEQGNALVGININGIPGKDKKTKPNGPNPLSYVGLLVSADGNSATPTEWDSRQWVISRDIGEFKISQQPEEIRGQNYQLSRWYSTYDWVANGGLDNFYTWIS